MKLIFIQQRPEAGDAVSFTFAPLEPLAWVAGQSIRIEVPGAYGPVEHRFTIASAPYENNIMITTRLSPSAFKKGLAKLQVGDVVGAYAIEGEVVWRDTNLPRIFAAAGVGITPFYSMLKQRLHDGQPVPVTLFYSSSTPDIIYKNELETWRAAHPEFTIHYVVGKRLSATHIAAAADIANSLIYVSGPSSMVDSLGAALIKQGTPEANLVRDWFTGNLPAQG